MKLFTVYDKTCEIPVDSFYTYEAAEELIVAELTDEMPECEFEILVGRVPAKIQST